MRAAKTMVTHIPIDGLTDADELEDSLELRDPQVKKQLAESWADIKTGRVRPAREFLAELKKKHKAAKSPARKHA